MKVIEPSVEILTPLDGPAILKHLELCGRVCYKSEDKITDGSAEKFCQYLIKRGHEAPLEHYSFSVRFIVDRGISHEIVRHRLASYCQESTRYCNYSQGKFENEITVVRPCFWERGSLEYAIWESQMHNIEKDYIDYVTLPRLGVPPEQARSVLPISLKTELIMTANIREWRHFLRLRTAPDAHPQMRQVALMLLEQLRVRIPVVFDYIGVEEAGNG